MWFASSCNAFRIFSQEFLVSGLFFSRMSCKINVCFGIVSYIHLLYVKHFIFIQKAYSGSNGLVKSSSCFSHSGV